MRLISTLAFLFFFSPLFATHNSAGEITYEQIGETTIRATIHTYTRQSSVIADRDSLELCWGDGQCEFVERNSQEINSEFEGVLNLEELINGVYFLMVKNKEGQILGQEKFYIQAD